MNRSFAGSLRLVLGLVLAAALAAGCVNHRKSADAAARAGNWKAAEAHYREALRKKPDDPDLQKKHAEAKTNAINQGLAQAQSCYDTKQWPCAVGEADYVAGIDPTNVQAKNLAAASRKAYALDDLAKARTAVTGDVAWGLDMVDHARTLSQDPDVLREAQSTTGALVAALIAQATDLRKQAAGAGPNALGFYDRAAALLERGAKTGDARCNQMLAEVRGERARWVDVEYERLAKLGDDGLIRNQWAAALANYQAAEELRAGGRGQSGAAYAKMLLDAETMVSQKNWRAAADLYRKASAMQQDNLTRKFAAAQIERVEVRPYRFRLASIFVNPLGPDGRPWADLAAVPANNRAVPAPPTSNGPRGPEYRQKVKGYASRIPPSYKPNLVVDVTLPDGRVMRTPARTDVWATFDGWFVLDSNQMDARPLVVTVKHVSKNGNEKFIGTVNVPVGSLVSRIEPPPAGPVLWTEFIVDQPRTYADGAFGGFASVVPGRANEATDASSPSSAAALGFRLARVDASIRGTANTAPDIKVEIEQSGRVIYRSPLIKDSIDGSWSPENVYVFAAPQEQLIVRLYDKDQQGAAAVVYGGAAAAPTDRLLTVEVKTATGSLARLVFEKRPTGP